jgi:hypothetical protein
LLNLFTTMRRELLLGHSICCNSLHRQIHYLLIPILFIILAGVVNCILVLTKGLLAETTGPERLQVELSLAKRMVRLCKACNGYLEAAHLHEQALRRLEEQVATSTCQATPSVDALLEIRILGPLSVAREGKPIPEATWGTERAKALLAYLLWKGPTGATREELSMSLWPARPAEQAANVFHVTLHSLRQALEPGPRRARDSWHILHERRRYRFNFDAPHWLDVTAFQTLAADGDVAALREAVTL